MLKSQELLRAQHVAFLAAQARLRQSHARYLELFARAPVAYITFSNSGLVLDLNAKAAELLGSPRALLRTLPFASRIAPGQMALFRRHLSRCRKTEDQVMTELRLLGGNGEELPVQMITAPVRDQKPASRELRTTLIDLTDLKRANVKLERARAQLERRVRDRTRELRQSNDELSAAIARRRELEAKVIEVSEREQRRFGQDLHDETCQSMGALSILAGLLANKIRGVAPEHSAELTDFSRELLKVIDQTRAIARNLHPVALGGGLCVALKTLALHLSDKIPCHCRCDEIPALSDETELAIYRIAQEATTNALRHARATQIIIGLRRRKAEVALSVEDNGIGIPADLPPDRMGMGLDIMEYRARLINGTLEVAKKPGGGTRVRCLFPLRDGAAAGSA